MMLFILLRIAEKDHSKIDFPVSAGSENSIFLKFETITLGLLYRAALIFLGNSVS